MPKDNETSMPAQLSTLKLAGGPVSVTFRDKAFRSRTVVFPDGHTAIVERGVVAVSAPEHVAFLNQHADFERVDGSA
ncbi:hypothetical protein [Paraburkholderia sediminicola]|uniref:hypothetical protein n=1 Tax=Paraburkholderia sediminicola TaxID=458836 RepID=UPI0038B6E7AE